MKKQAMKSRRQKAMLIIIGWLAILGVHGLQSQQNPVEPSSAVATSPSTESTEVASANVLPSIKMVDAPPTGALMAEGFLVAAAFGMFIAAALRTRPHDAARQHRRTHEQPKTKSAA